MSTVDKLNDLKKRIEEIQTKSLVAGDIKAFITLVLSVVNKTKEELANLSQENIKVIKDSIAYIEEFHEKQANTLDGKINTATGQFDANLALLKALLVKVEAIKATPGKDGRDGVDGIGIDGKNGKDGKDGSPDTRVQIVEKINTGKKKDLKIEAEQIAGFDKIEKSISDRALSILDQRTKFLINKGVKHDATLTGSGTDADPLSVPGGGGTVGPGTINEIAYFDTTTSIASLTVATYPSLTELSYVKGVTSAIQTQINTKANSAGSLTQFVGNGTWKVGYTDGSGDWTELSLGADGTFLKSNGASSAPTFATPAGSGDVSKVGTPVDNQVGVWTGDGTIEGDAALTYDATTDILTSVTFAGALTGIASGNALPALSNLASVAINTTLVSDTDNTDALGTTAIAWSDIFLGSGAVITFNSAPSTPDVTITHSANLLTIAGGDVTLPNLTITSFAANWTNAGRTVADLGIVTTVDINGGTIDGVTIGGASAGAGTFTTLGGTTITASVGFALGDGDYIGVTGNEIITFATAGTITVSGATFALGSNSLTMTGSIAATGARVTKGWFTDLEVTNGITIGGAAFYLPLGGGTMTGAIKLGEN